MIKKTIVILVSLLSIFDVVACENTSPKRSEYVVDINRYSHKGESCISYTVLFQKRTAQSPNNFLTGVRVGLVSESNRELFGSKLELREAVEDQFIAAFCVDEALVKESYLELSISLPQSLELGERGTTQIGGFACMEQQKVYLKDLPSYSR